MLSACPSQFCSSRFHTVPTRLRERHEERLTQAVEKQAAAYGKTGVDRLVAERDRLIKKLGDEEGTRRLKDSLHASMLTIVPYSIPCKTMAAGPFPMQARRQA